MLHVHARLLVAGGPVDGGIRASRRTCAPAVRTGALRAGGRGARRGGLAGPHGLPQTPPDRGQSFSRLSGAGGQVCAGGSVRRIRSGSPGLPRLRAASYPPRAAGRRPDPGRHPGRGPLARFAGGGTCTRLSAGVPARSARSGHARDLVSRGGHAPRVLTGAPRRGKTPAAADANTAMNETAGPAAGPGRAGGKDSR
jgi:hypothetical protein